MSSKFNQFELNKFYVTTPIYYVTAKPHLGSLYSTVLADVSARFHKLLGQEVFFLTGTDEHGQKIAQAAAQAGQNPKEFVDSFIKSYQMTWQNYQIEYNRFIRTTDQYHVVAVQAWLQNLIDQGDIYKSQYRGWYCTPDEMFVTEKEYEAGAKQVVCPACGRETQFVSEESYFFRLSNYQEKLLTFYKQNPDFIIPKEKINEVIRFVESGLKDLCISRSTISWGIPFPGDSQHVTYVWADALNNYITAVGYGDQKRELDFVKWWPADLQILGKDILRFHAIYWPAFLMASNLALPKHLLVHGWIKVGDQKMSKSLDNVVDPDLLNQEYGSDQIRYYLTNNLAITHDSNFDLNILRETLTADLANNLGNLLSRMTSLALKHDLACLIKPSKFDIKSQDLLDLIKIVTQDYTKLMQDCSYHMAISQVNRLITSANVYFHELEPWVLAKTNPDLFKEVLWITCAVLEVVSVLFWPIMPSKMQELAKRISKHDTVLNLILNQSVQPVNLIQQIILGQISHEFNLQTGPVLFLKYEKLELLESKKVKELNVPENLINYIEFEDFLKVELLVGTIEQCEAILGS